MQNTGGTYFSTHFWTNYTGILFPSISPPETDIYILFIPNLHVIIISERSPQTLTQIGVGPAHTITESGESER